MRLRCLGRRVCFPYPLCSAVVVRSMNSRAVIMGELLDPALHQHLELVGVDRIVCVAEVGGKLLANAVRKTTSRPETENRPKVLV